MNAAIAAAQVPFGIFDMRPEAYPSLEQFERATAPWLSRYPACVPKTLSLPTTAAYGLLERAVEEFPDRIACAYYQQRLTYRQLAERSRRTADMLTRLGVKPGDRVGVLLPNIPEFLSTLNGIWMAGASAVAISPLSCAEEISDLLEATECQVVIGLDILAPLLYAGRYQPKHFVETTLQDRLPRLLSLGYSIARWRRLKHGRPSAFPKPLNLTKELRHSDPHFEPVKLRSQSDPAFLLATGGTTGRPKIVVLSHRNVIANASQLHAWSGYRRGEDSILAVVPFFHCYGLSTCAMAGIAMAATIIMHHRFVPKIVLKLIEEHKPTIFQAVPAMLVALNDLMKDRKTPLGGLQFCTSGGAPLDPHVGAEFSRLTGAEVVEGFGLSEAGPVTHVGPLDGTARPGTIGLPLPDTQVRIVDADNGVDEVAPGEVGELIIKGPQVMVGYWRNPEATAQTVRDGWLFTGDLATRDEDGFFKIVDRKKDLIITSGFNVYPTDVEHTLRTYPGIRDVAVVGVPDSVRGEMVKAVVVPEPGTKFDKRAFDQFAREHLSKHKRPLLVDVLEGDLPRNFLGKVYRRKLREAHTALSSADSLSSSDPSQITVKIDNSAAAPGIGK